MLLSTLGERIRKVRGRLSQKEFGQKLGVSRSTIAGYEANNNEPPLELLVLIAKLGNVSMDWLSGNDSVSSHDSEVMYHDPLWKEFLALARQKNINPQSLIRLVNESLNLTFKDT